MCIACRYLGLVLSVAIWLCAPAHAERRVALVVGIDAYQNVPALQKGVNDARGVAARLEQLKFEVIRVENASRRAIDQAVGDFANRIQAGDVAFFFFAGHGIEIGGSNYLLPADTPSPRDGKDSLILDAAVSADSIIAKMQGHKPLLSMLVLDACRDNPFKPTGTQSQSTRGLSAAFLPGGPSARSLANSRGLTQTTTPEGVFVIYSAGVGQTALDRLSDADTDPNSVFTRTLLPNLGRPGLSIQDMAKRTQSEVRRLASTVAHQQMPAYYDQVLGVYVMTPGEASAGTGKPDSASDVEGAYWATISESRNGTDFEGYLNKYPQGRFTEFARARLKALSAPPAGEAAPVPAGQTDVTGEWSGIATSGSARYRYNWRLRQSGTQVEGTIHLASQDGTSYAFYSMQGVVERDRLIFAGSHFIENVSTRGSYWCLASGTLKIGRDGRHLEGRWGPNNVTGGCEPNTGGAVVLDRVDLTGRR